MLTDRKIDGKEIAASVRREVKSTVSKLKNAGIVPCLATILVGDNTASATYVRNKHAACESVGIRTKDYRLDSSIMQAELVKTITKLNDDSTVHGILVQLPLPEHLDEFKITSSILPAKDVDGLTPYNMGLLTAGKASLIACTPAGIMRMLEHYAVNLEGAHVVIINRSTLTGKPLCNLLLARNATVTVCHSKTRRLEEHTRRADIVVTAVGNRNRFKLTSDMIKDGSIVIDVAISRYNGKLAGDTDYDEIVRKASFATPVPGGVGPMTVAMLLKNTVAAASMKNVG